MTSLRKSGRRLKHLRIPATWGRPDFCRHSAYSSASSPVASASSIQRMRGMLVLHCQKRLAVHALHLQAGTEGPVEALLLPFFKRQDLPAVSAELLSQPEHIHPEQVVGTLLEVAQAPRQQIRHAAP